MLSAKELRDLIKDVPDDYQVDVGRLPVPAVGVTIKPGAKKVVIA